MTLTRIEAVARVLGYDDPRAELRAFRGEGSRSCFRGHREVVLAYRDARGYRSSFSDHAPTDAEAVERLLTRLTRLVEARIIDRREDAARATAEADRLTAGLAAAKEER